MRFQPVIVDLSDFKYTDEPITNDEPSSYDDAGYSVQDYDCFPNGKRRYKKPTEEPKHEIFDAAEYVIYASGVLPE